MVGNVTFDALVPERFIYLSRTAKIKW